MPRLLRDHVIDVPATVWNDAIRNTQNGFGTLRREAAEKYADALSAIEKLQFHKAMLRAGSSTKFASMMGQGR
ncbi:hypothetical protein [Rhodobacter sp. NSM]|uniref:hypothetical protein n=1 Tax=Rhodobacter sp. NSM TaxID=3457501 RepID=UPI003FD67A49